MDEDQLETPVVGDSAPDIGGLTRQEQVVMYHLITAWDAFLDIPTVVGDDHLAAFGMAIHQAQSILARRVAGRMFPGFWTVIM